VPSIEHQAELTAAELSKVSALGITSLMDAYVTPGGGQGMAAAA